MEYVLQTKNLKKSYKSTNVLNHFDMNIPKGAIYGFIGKNGAGKTTLIRLICSLQKPNGGTYYLFGKEYTDKNIQLCRQRMSAIVENPAVYLNMSAADNLKQQYRLLGLPNYEGLDELLDLVGLAHTKNKKAADFSLGMRQRLAIGVSLVGHPDFLVLDEPVNGLDPEGILEVRELILKLNKEKQITILISSHFLDELSKIATHYGFIKNGKIVEEIEADKLNQKKRMAMRLQVSNMPNLIYVLDRKKMEYSVVNDNTVDIYSSFLLSDLSEELKKRNCEILMASKAEQSLESHYLDLMEGDFND